MVRPQVAGIAWMLQHVSHTHQQQTCSAEGCADSGAKHDCSAACGANSGAKHQHVLTIAQAKLLPVLG